MIVRIRCCTNAMFSTVADCNLQLPEISTCFVFGSLLVYKNSRDAYGLPFVASGSYSALEICAL